MPERVELGTTARVIGNVFYNLIEMAIGAEINGKLIHEPAEQGTAVRKKFFFKVYAAAAYLDEGTETGEDPGATYVAADAPKRTASGPTSDDASDDIRGSTAH